MGDLLGLQDYLGQSYEKSIFEQAKDSGQAWEFHIHGGRIIRGKILENPTYDLKMDIEDNGEQVLPKVEVKLVYPVNLSESVRPLIKIDEAVRALGLGPIFSPRKRTFVKNKSLYPLMKEKEVVFLTLLEGEIIRGVVTGFSRYEITMSLKNRNPVTILRHSIYDLRNKKGRCFLKKFQEEHRDWEKSPFFVPES